MEIRAVLQARVVQWMHLPSPPFLPEVIRQVQERYQFVEKPEKLGEVLSQDQPLVFRHGVLMVGTRSIVIGALVVGRKGLLVDVATNTADCDLILDDMLEWATGAFGLSLGPRLPASQLEVVFSIDLERAFPQLAMIPQRLLAHNRALNPKFAEAQTPTIHFSGVTISPDPDGPALACDFRLERRDKQPYKSNLYFAQAPLGTEEHERLLIDLEAELQR